MRRGASTSAKKARVDVPTKTYAVARKKLNVLLKEFAFCKVSEVIHAPPKDGRPAFFHGTLITQSNSKFNVMSERVFFDKGGRLRYNSLIEIGPCKLIDAAWGRDHHSAHPQVGDILIGVLEPNQKKGSIPKVLKSWSRHGKILMELSRMVEFGTSLSEIETRNLLCQSECFMAEQAKQIQQIGASFVSSILTRNATDDFWMLARLILWGNIRPFVVLHSLETSIVCKDLPTDIEIAVAKDIKISTSAYDFITGLSFRLEDSDIITDFMNSFVKQEAPPPFHYVERPNSPPYRPSSPTSKLELYDPESAISQSTPPYEQSSSAAYAQCNPEKAPSSPAYAPSSPAYAPSSPAYAPSSPAYAPSSPPLMTSSPPKSPVAFEDL